MYGILYSVQVITESQNRRGRKGPPEIIESNPPAKAGSLHQVTQVRVQVGLEYLQRRRLHNLPGQPVPVLRHLTVKKFLRTLERNFLCSSFRPFPLVLSPHAAENSLASPLCPPHLRYLLTWIRSPLSLLFSRLNRPSSLSLSSQGRCPRPFTVFVALRWTLSKRSLSFLYWGVQNWTQYSSLWRCSINI